MARIKHPNPQAGTFTDRIGGVVFYDGFAEVDLTGDDNLRDAYLMHGYEVEETTAEILTSVGVSDDDLPSAAAGVEKLTAAKPRSRKKA